MCVQREREEERKKETERAPGWGGKNDFSQSVTAHTYTHTNLDIYFRYTCLEITFLKILSKALRS